MDKVEVIHPDGHMSAERIPGEHDASTLMHRQPGSMGGKPNGEDIPAAAPQWDDAAGRREHELDGGGPASERRRGSLSEGQQ
jgi:hypothetical protein